MLNLFFKLLQSESKFSKVDYSKLIRKLKKNKYDKCNYY